MNQTCVFSCLVTSVKCNYVILYLDTVNLDERLYILFIRAINFTYLSVV